MAENKKQKITREELVKMVDMGGMTEKQQNLLQLKIENLMLPLDEQRPDWELQVDAGYAESTAKCTSIDDTIRQRAMPVVKKLAMERLRAIKMLPDKIDKAKYRDLVQAIDILTRNIESLEGRRPVEDRNKLHLTDKQYNRLIKREARRLGMREAEEAQLVEVKEEKEARVEENV